MQKNNTVRYNGTEWRICEYNRAPCRLPAFTFDGMKERICYNNNNNNNNKRRFNSSISLTYTVIKRLTILWYYKKYL